MRVQSLFVDEKGSIIMNKEAQDHELTETAILEGGREASDSSFWKKLEQKKKERKLERQTAQ